ncbi:MAG: DNA methyltransferase [Chloroflexales bacterium]|nr:DNA methyltransferase [Chloroflexales bacterium]
MDERASQDLPPFDDNHAAEDDATLSLNEALFVDLIQQWKSIELLSSLRQAIVEMKRRIGDADDELRKNGDGVPTTVFNKSYLLADLDQIAESLTLERAHYYLDRLLKSIREVKTNAINDINLNRWKEYKDIYTDSLWLIDRRDSSGVHTAGYWGNFVPQIPHQMMQRYTKKGEWVLDTFAGSGTTLIEGQRLGRHAIGIELQSRMVEHTRRLAESEQNPHNVTIDIIEDDSTYLDYKALLKKYKQESVQLVVMHPPYFDIIKFSDDPRDLSNAPSVEGFLAMMGRLIDKVAPVLDKGRYLVLVIGDKYVKGDWIPLGFQTMNEVMQRSFALKSIIVKNFDDTSAKRNQKELWRYRALVGGFYIFKHEYIFLFKKQ